MSLRTHNSVPENPPDHEEATGDTPPRLYTRLDTDPVDVTIPGHFVRDIMSARTVTDRERETAKLVKHWNENMEGEERNIVSKFLHSKWARYIGCAAAGAVALGAGMITFGDTPDWLSDLWNKVPSWNDVSTSGSNLADRGTNWWNGLSNEAKLGVVGGAGLALPVGAIGTGLVVRRLRKGNREAREERVTIERNLDAKIESIENKSVRFKRETF